MIDVLCLSLILVLARVAFFDVSHRRITNNDVGIVVVLWLLYTPFLVSSSIIAAIGLAMLVLTLGFAVWRAGWLGAGDAKLVAALTLWAGPDHGAFMLLTIIFCGGAIAAAMLVMRRHEFVLHWLCARLVPARCRSESNASATLSMSVGMLGAKSVPYGVAIAAGGIWVACRLIAG